MGNIILCAFLNDKETCIKDILSYHKQLAIYTKEKKTSKKK